MTVEEIIESMRALDSEERSLAKRAGEISERRAQLIAELEGAGKGDWDWVSVRYASNLTGIPQSSIYCRINGGKLSVRHLGAKKLIRLSEVKAIDDRYAAR